MSFPFVLRINYVKLKYMHFSLCAAVIFLA